MATTPAPLLSPEETALADFTREQAAKSLTDDVEQLRARVARTRRKDGKIRNAKFLAAVLALRFEGKGPKETATILGVSESRVYRVLSQVRNDASIDRLLDRIDQVALPLSVDNAILGVARGDKDYTLEMLRGRGLLRTHKSIDAQVKQTVLTLQVQISDPDHYKGKDLPPPRMGSIVGAPVNLVGNAHLGSRDAAPAPEPLTIDVPGGRVVAAPPMVDTSKAD